MLNRKTLAILLLAASIQALLFWMLGFTSSICKDSACTMAYLFNRPWMAYGAVFYAVIAVLFTIRKKVADITRHILLISGVVTHAVLLCLQYRSTKEICFICAGYALITVVTTLASFFIGSEHSKWEQTLSWLTAVIACGLIVLWIFNPTPGSEAQAGGITTEYHYYYQQNADVKSDYLYVDTNSGKQVRLNLSSKPVLLFAWWCPHCTDALKTIDKMPADKRPVLVDTFFAAADIAKIKTDLAKAGMPGAYYYVLPSPPSYVSGVPTLLYYSAGQVRTITGEPAVTKWADRQKGGVLY